MSKSKNRDLSSLAERLLEVGRLAYGDASSRQDLTRTQWAALRYFARANRYSRTVSGFCAYYGVTPGTASETIRRMIGRGLLQSYQSPIDGRSVLLEMTLKARGLLKEDPSQILVSVVERLPVAQATAVAAALEQVARMIGERHGRRVFGSCGGCRHFSAGRARAGARRQRCRLLGVRIEAGEEQALCAMFEGS